MRHNEKMSRNVLVSGGCSGKEPFPPRFVRSLRRRPILGVKTVIPNPLAIQQGVHTVEHPYSMMLAFGAEEPRNNEERCADRLEQKAQGFDLVVDLHTSPSTTEAFVAVGINARPIVWQTVAALGMKRVILMDLPGSFYSHVLHGLAIEFPETMLDDGEGQQRLRERLGFIASGAALPGVVDCTFYRYAGIVERQDTPAAPDFLPDFTELNPEWYQHTGKSGPLYALGWFVSGTTCRGEMLQEATDMQVVDGQLVNVVDKKGG